MIAQPAAVAEDQIHPDAATTFVDRPQAIPQLQPVHHRNGGFGEPVMHLAHTIVDGDAAECEAVVAGVAEATALAAHDGGGFQLHALLIQHRAVRHAHIYISPHAAAYLSAAER